MFKLGDKVRVKRDCQWHKDIGDSIGILVAIPKEGYSYLDYKVIFKYEDFLNKDTYWKLHRCECSDSYDVDMRYYSRSNRSRTTKNILKGVYSGYSIDSDGIEHAKRGNSNLFR